MMIVRLRVIVNAVVQMEACFKRPYEPGYIGFFRVGWSAAKSGGKLYNV